MTLVTPRPVVPFCAAWPPAPRRPPLTTHRPRAWPARRPPPGGAGQPNVVVVSIDDLGWDELGCYGNTFNETPTSTRWPAAASASPRRTPPRRCARPPAPPW